MKVNILRSCAGADFSFAAGDTAELKKAVAEDLITAGYAERTPKDTPGTAIQDNGGEGSDGEGEASG